MTLTSPESRAEFVPIQPPNHPVAPGRFFSQSLLEREFSVTALLTRKTAVSGTAKIDWNDYVFFRNSESAEQCCQKSWCLADVLEQESSNCLQNPKYFSKLWP